MGTKLPQWMKVVGDGVVLVDPDLAYPPALAALGVAVTWGGLEFWSRAHGH